MDPALVVSPHLDDAVLSAGRFLAGHERVIVATLFTGTPPDPTIQTTYDRDCGFTDAAEAMAARRIEDRTALGLLDASPVHFGYVDHQYRGDDTSFEAGALYELNRAVEIIGNVYALVGPLGLAHPDHVAAARIFADLAAAHPEMEAWVYEDLPSRVLWPEQVPDRLAVWRARWPDMRLDFPGTGHAYAKEQAIDCYRSQLWALDLHTVLVPERFYRLNP